MGRGLCEGVELGFGKLLCLKSYLGIFLQVFRVP